MVQEQKPSVQMLHAIKLKCLYCGVTPLQKEGSYFDFDQGCKKCNYRFERELGYFNAASGLVFFPIISLLGLSIAIVLMVMTKLGGIYVAGISSLVMLPFAFFFLPYGYALWMYVEHKFHPLNEDDNYNNELLN